MGRALLWSLPLIAAFTLAIALLGLAYGFAQTAAIERESYAGWFIPHNVENLRRFLCAGYMHNSAYLGGALSIPAAWLFHIHFSHTKPDNGLNRTISGGCHCNRQRKPTGLTPGRV